MTDTEPVWQPGHELSSWPELKFERARQHADELASRVRVWVAATKIDTVKVISDDQHSLELYVQMPSPAPLAELALALGDSVHNLRCALDAVVWDLAHLDGGSPEDPRDVSFPISRTENAWKRAAARSLASVPAKAVERIRHVQPFLYVDPGTDTAMSILHDADIRDKHRTQIECRFFAQGFSLDDSVFQFVDEREIPTPPFDLEVHKDGQVLDGEKIMTFRSSARFARARVPMKIDVQVMVDRQGEWVKVEDFLNTLFTQVRGTLEIVYRGVEAAKRAPGADAPEGDGAPQPPTEWDVEAPRLEG